MTPSPDPEASRRVAPNIEPRSDSELLTSVVYELLDAHHDTIDLAERLQDDLWRAHLDYLRALQRRSRELLARASGHPQPDRRGEPSG